MEAENGQLDDLFHFHVTYPQNVWSTRLSFVKPYAIKKIDKFNKQSTLSNQPLERIWLSQGNRPRRGAVIVTRQTNRKFAQRTSSSNPPGGVITLLGKGVPT